MEHTAIDKALGVLFHLHAQPGPVGVSELGRALSLPRSSAHRLLGALRRYDLVEQGEDGRYQIGFGLLALATKLLAQDQLLLAARPALTQAAATLGETFFLVAARGGRLHVLDKVEGTGVLRASPPLGAVVPAHATAAGKLYLAYAPSELQLPRERARFTARTLLDDEALAAEVAHAKERGYAQNQQEWIEGLSVLAAPILSEDRLHGAVCVALPSARLSQLGEHAVATRLLAASARICNRIQGVAR
jgi:DNA-binding IclR family transcriptional regulator